MKRFRALRSRSIARSWLLIALGCLPIACQSPPSGGSFDGGGVRVARITTSSGARVATESLGAGAPALVFLHGWCGDRWQWRAQAEAFAARGRVILIDLPGHGESEVGGAEGAAADPTAPELAASDSVAPSSVESAAAASATIESSAIESSTAAMTGGGTNRLDESARAALATRIERPWEIESLAAEVAEVLARLELDEVVLVGHSLGALVALEVARAEPALVRGVVAVDTLHDPTRRVPEPDLQRALASYRRDFEGTQREFATQLFGPRAPERVRRQVLEALLRPSDEPDFALAAFESFLRHDAAAALTACPVPVLCIQADQRPTNFDAGRALDPDLKVQILPEVGHYLMLEEPRRFESALERCLVELSSAEAPRSAARDAASEGTVAR